MSLHRNIDNLSFKQKGATLVTTLILLILMTIVSVSAAKISIFNVIASGNEQQKVMLFQQTENDLKNITTVIELYKPMTGDDGAEFALDTGVYQVPEEANSPDTKLKITDTNIRYACNGFSGQALSLGPSVPRCDLYDFEAKIKKHSSGANDRHNRGAGKEKPNLLKNSYLSN